MAPTHRCAVAVEQAYYEVTGESPGFIFSGWGASLTEPERACVEDREPSDAHYTQWEFVRWLASLEEDHEARRSVTLSEIIERARAVLAGGES